LNELIRKEKREKGKRGKEWEGTERETDTIIQQHNHNFGKLLEHILKNLKIFQ